MIDRAVIDRVVIINDLSYPKGGASALALQAAVALAGRGLQVSFLCGTGPSPALEAAGVEVQGLGQDRLLATNPLAAAIRGIYNRAAAAMVESWIVQHDTPKTIYHVHGWSQILSPSLFAALSQVQERVLVHAHDFFFSCPNGAMFDYHKSAPCTLKPMSTACILTACDRRGRAAKAWRVARQHVQRHTMPDPALPQLLIHSGMTPYFAKAGLTEQDMFVLPNPVAPYTHARIRAEAHRDILFVGRLEATKGIDLAAQACRMAGVRLVAIGAGDLLETLQRDYPEMVWAGHCTHDEIAVLARQARMLIMPSRHIEPFGLAAVEALWSGLPVLSSATSLITADIVDADAGLAIEPRDTRSLAAMLFALSRDDARVEQMSKNAYQQTGSLALTHERWIDALIAAYGSYLAHGRPGLGAAARAWTRAANVSGYDHSRHADLAGTSAPTASTTEVC